MQRYRVMIDRNPGQRDLPPMRPASLAHIGEHEIDAVLSAIATTMRTIGYTNVRVDAMGYPCDCTRCTGKQQAVRQSTQQFEHLVAQALSLVYERGRRFAYDGAQMAAPFTTEESLDQRTRSIEVGALTVMRALTALQRALAEPLPAASLTVTS